MGRIVQCLLAGMLAIGAPSLVWAADWATMAPFDIATLQHRLTEAGCYAGPIDGRASPDTARAVSECPSQDPVLQIETGMHTAAIKGLDVDSRCDLAATGSEDKTLRLWSLPEGRLVRTIRLPVGPEGNGAVRAVALSSDGAMVVAGGWDAASAVGKGHGIYVIDLGSGGVHRLGAFSMSINALAMSRDSTLIAAAVGLGATGGVHVIDLASGREVMSDTSYRGGAYGVAFGADGSLFTTSDDGYVRRYDRAMKRTAAVTMPAGSHPADIQVDPSGTRVAVGDHDSPALAILDAATLGVVAKGDTGGITAGALSTLTWTAGGQAVVAGGTAHGTFDKTSRAFLRVFDPSGKHISVDLPVSDNSIFGLRACGAKMLFTTASPAFGAIDEDGNVQVLQGPPILDARSALGRVDGLRISADASSVRFALDLAGADQVRFDLSTGALTEAPSAGADLHGTATSGLPITDWLTRTDPKLDGTPLPLSLYERSESLAIRAERDGFVLGTAWHLRAFTGDGQLRWSMTAAGAADGVNFSADGQVVVATYDDGTIRWHRWSDGATLLTLFVDVRTKRWVAWTPTGYYMASPGGEDLIGWHINRGWQQEADFFPASRFRDRFNRPEIVRLILATLDENEAVRQSNAAAKRPDNQAPIIETLPPVITIVSPADGSPEAAGSLTVRYLVRSPSGDKVDRVEAFVDGVKTDARGLGPAPTPGQEGTMTVPMPAHDAVVSLVAYAAGRASDAATVRLSGIQTTSGETADGTTLDDALKPTLYALLIGVSAYDNPSYNLGYAAQDATGLAAALMSQKGKFYKDVQAKVLTDKDATSIGVKRGLLWLQKQMTSRDLAVVFAAGHGLTDAQGRFWFLTADADLDALTVSAVSQDDFSLKLFELPGKKLLFLDACHSGAALNAGRPGGRWWRDRHQRGVERFRPDRGRRRGLFGLDWPRILVRAGGVGPWRVHQGSDRRHRRREGRHYQFGHDHDDNP